MTFVDISSRQPTSIDWKLYATFSRETEPDHLSKVTLRASEGLGVPDSKFGIYYPGAAKWIDILGVYHYAYPNLHPGEAGAIREASYFAMVVGHTTNTLRRPSFFMLDYEQQVKEATADWAFAFLEHMELLTNQVPVIYASLSYVLERLQDTRLARFPLILADWTFHPTSRPAAPHPWSKYLYLQYSDRVVVPGIVGGEDGNIYVGQEPEPGPPIVVKVNDLEIKIEAASITSVSVDGLEVYPPSTARPVPLPVEPPVSSPEPTPEPVSEPTPEPRTYTIQSHDTLSGIAQQQGVDEASLCSLNHELLDATARQHRLPGTDVPGDPCHYIWAGTVLVLP